MKKIMKNMLPLTALLIMILPCQAQEYWDRDEPVIDAGAVHLDDTGLDEVAVIMSSLITPGYVFDLLDDEPIWEASGWWGDAELWVTGLNFNYPVVIDLDSFVNSLKIDLYIYNFYMQVDGYVSILDVTADFTANPVHLSGRLHVENVGGELVCSITNVVVDLQNFDWDIANWPDWLEFLIEIFVGDIETEIENAIRTAVSEQIPPMLCDFLNELELEEQIPVFDDVITFYMKPDDTKMNIYGLSVWMKADCYGEPDPCVPGLPGSMKNLQPRPSYTNFIPNTEVPFQGAIILSDDMLNRVLFAAFDVGMLCFRIDDAMAEELGLPIDLNSGLLSLIVPRIADLAPESPMILNLRPLEPPVMEYNHWNDEYKISMDLHNMLADFYVEIWGHWVRLFTMALNIDDVQLNLEITLNDKIHIAISEDFEFSSTIVYDPMLGLTQTEKDALEGFIENLLPSLLPLFLESLEDFPIPSFEGYSLDVKEIMIHGNRGYAGIFGDLIIETYNEDEYMPWWLENLYRSGEISR